MDEVVARAEPQGLGGAAGERRRVRGGDERAEGAQARVRRRDRLGEGGADHRVDAVRADHDVGRGRLAVGEPQRVPRTVLLQGDAALPEADRRGGDRVPDGIEQVGAVRGVGALAEQGLALRRQVFRGQHAAVLPAAELPAGLQDDGALRERAEDAEGAQQAGGVRRDDHARADFRELGRLLVDGGRQARAVQERRGGQAADAPADDRDLGHEHTEISERVRLTLIGHRFAAPGGPAGHIRWSR